MLTKLEPRIDLYARKLREMYYREGTLPPHKSYLNPIRMRDPTDTLEKGMEEKVIPGVIKARDEFEDVDMVWPWKAPFEITRVDHGAVKPWYCVHPETEEEIRVTVSKIEYHDKTRLPYYMEFQRYIVGRPNLLCLNIDPV